MCKPPTKAAFAGSTAMQVLVAWTRLELREGNLRVVRLKLQEPALCVVQSIMVGVVWLGLAGRLAMGWGAFRMGWLGGDLYSMQHAIIGLGWSCLAPRVHR